MPRSEACTLVMRLTDTFLANALSHLLHLLHSGSACVIAVSSVEITAAFKEHPDNDWILLTESSLIDVCDQDPSGTDAFGTEEWNTLMGSHASSVSVIVLRTRFMHVDTNLLTARFGSRWAVLSKDTCTIERLLLAIQSVRSGLSIIEQMPKGGRPRIETALDEKEQQILALVASGLSNQAVARQLHVSEKTVERALRSCYRKLQLTESSSVMNSRVAAALCYHGLLPQSEALGHGHSTERSSP
jgi:DNA-binding NarL/FixJ family response regulator